MSWPLLPQQSLLPQILPDHAERSLADVSPLREERQIHERYLSLQTDPVSLGAFSADPWPVNIFLPGQISLLPVSAIQLETHWQAGYFLPLRQARQFNTVFVPTIL